MLMAPHHLLTEWCLAGEDLADAHLKEVEDADIQYRLPGSDGNSSVQQQPQQAARREPVHHPVQRHQLPPPAVLQLVPQQLPRQLPQPLPQQLPQLAEEQVLPQQDQQLLQGVLQLQQSLDQQQDPQELKKQVQQLITSVQHRLSSSQLQQGQGQQQSLVGQQEAAQQQVVHQPTAAQQQVAQQLPGAAQQQVAQQLLRAAQQQVTQQPPRAAQQQVAEAWQTGGSSPVQQFTSCLSELEFDPLNPAAAAAAHPLSAPFAELIESPLQQMRPPPALQDVQGDWAYIHKRGVGMMAVAPPSPSPQRKLVLVQASQRSSMVAPSATADPLPAMQHGVPVYSTASIAMPSTATATQGAALEAPAIMSSGTVAVQQQPRQLRAIPELRTMSSMTQLYKVVVHGNELAGTLSFADMEKADPKWRSTFSRQRYAEFKGAVDEIDRLAVVAGMAPLDMAAQMDADRLNQKNKGVAGYVKKLLSARSTRNKGMH